MLIGTLQHEEYFFINQEVGDNFNQQVDSGMDMTTESTPFTSRYSDNLTRPPFDFSKQVGWNLGSVAVFLATTRHRCIVVDEFAPTVYLSSSSSSGLNLNWCCPKAVPRMMSRWFYFSIVCNRLFPLIACIKLFLLSACIKLFLLIACIKRFFVHCLHQTPQDTDDGDVNVAGHPSPAWATSGGEQLRLDQRLLHIARLRSPAGGQPAALGGGGGGLREGGRRGQGGRGHRDGESEYPQDDSRPSQVRSKLLK